MAAIDKIYVKSREQYIQFKEWCKQQPPIADKYGQTAKLTDYIYYWDAEVTFDGGRPIFNAPCYLDAYLIRNCPFDFIQKELMINYGHWSQEKINDAYNCVMNRTEENKDFFSWLTPEDFVIKDNVITMPNLEKSDYEKIKDNELYTKPTTHLDYTVGKHFRCIKHPYIKYNTPFKYKNWFINVELPNMFSYMWYHSKHNTWDFSDEFVISDWSSSTAFCKTIKALKRHMIKWKLPVGTIVTASSCYPQETYKFIITK